MRQHHDKAFVDYSGKKIGIVDPESGAVRDAEIFVAVLRASKYTYADWIEAHVRLFRFLGGVPRLVVPDNLKSGVHKASFYETDRSYPMMATHCDAGIQPAPPRRPRDKAKVEAAVRFARSASSNAFGIRFSSRSGKSTRRLRSCLGASMPTSCVAWASASTICPWSVERSALKPLPATDYEFAEWPLARVGFDYHVEVHSFFYSVPHA
jgi:hypothetical protein